MIIFFIPVVIVALFRHSCRASNLRRYLSTDSVFQVTLITVVWNNSHKGIFQSIFYLAGMCDQSCNLFFHVWPWELGLSVMSEANSSSCSGNSPSSISSRSVCSTAFLPLLRLQTFPLYWFHPLRIWIYSSICYIEKKSTLLIPLPSPVLSPCQGRPSDLTEGPLISSSLPHLLFAATPVTTVTNFGEKILLCEEVFLCVPHLSL